MKNPFAIGDILVYTKVVQENEIAAFESGVVHHVYATFSLAKDAEWSTRLFVLQMKEAHEEGIGTFIHVDHVAPALVGSTVHFYARLDAVQGHEILCSFEAKVGDRLVAKGTTGQKIIAREKLDRLISALQS